jgi:hypothetical protein
MTAWLSVFPDWCTLVLFIVVPAALAVAAHVAFRRFVDPERLLPHHDVAGFLVAIVGVLYAVVLGFVVVTVWSNFDSVQRTADVEASDVGDAYAYSLMLPEPPRKAVGSMLANYALEVRDHEWALLREGRADPKARAYLVGAFLALARAPAPPSAGFDEALRAESTRQSVLEGLRSIADNRRLRLIQAQERIPAALYVALLMGACMVMAFVFLFGVEHRGLQLTMTGIVAGCIGLLLGVIVAFDSPFRGPIRVSPEAWTSLVDVFHFDRFPRIDAPQPPTGP